MREILRRLFRRSSVDDQIREEIESHIAMRADQNREAGMPEDDALLAARRQFGNPTAVRETLYDFNSFGWLDTLARDLVYALRGLGRNPALSLTAIVTVAIGVGATTSMFSVMRNLFLAPPPHVSSPERVHRLHQTYYDASKDKQAEPFRHTSYPFYEFVAGRTKSLESVGAYWTDRNLAVGSGTDARMARVVMVSAGFWQTLGVQPALGRFIRDEEAHPVTGARVVVLGHAFWQSRFGGRADAVGSTLRIKGQPYDIIGVAPRGFRGVELADVDLWLPLFAEGDGSGPVKWHTSQASYILKIVTRLKPGITAEQASAELTGLQRPFLEEAYRNVFQDPAELERYRRARTLLGPLTGGLGDDLRPVPEARVTEWLVGVAIVLVAISCLNVGGLLLLRAMRRRREIAVRLALGISRGRLVRQLLTESSVLALLGGLAALVTVAWGGVWLQRTILPAIAWEPSTLIHPSVLAVAGLCTLAATISAGMAPLFYARSNILSALHDGSRGGLGRRPRIQSALLAAQGALSVVLLVGAGLFLRSLHNAETLDIGMDRDEVLAVEVDFSGTGRSSADIAAFFERALERMPSVPGVTRASLALSLPLRSAHGSSVRLFGRNELLTAANGSVPFVNYVTPDFFETTGMRIVQGRGFVQTDRNVDPVVVVNETMAARGWPDQSPVGQCIYRSRGEPCATVVGVAADARRFKITDEPPIPYWYTPLLASDPGPRSLLVRMAPGAGRMDSAIRQAMQEIDPSLPFVSIETLGEALDPEIRPWRLGASVFTAFGILAMGLAMIGLWSSVSYAVSQRKHEFAVRLAVGARPRSLVRLVLADGLTTALTAIALGMMIAAAAADFIANLLFGVSPHDPLTFGLIGLGVLAIAAGASLLPAWHASRTNPSDALRAD